MMLLLVAVVYFDTILCGDGGSLNDKTGAGTEEDSIPIISGLIRTDRRESISPLNNIISISPFNIIPLVNQSCLSNKAIASFPRKSLLHSFKIASLHQCWKFCKFSSVCGVFVFHLLTRICSLYIEAERLTYQDVLDDNVVVGDLNCLECIGGVEDVVEKSKTGILIMFIESDGVKMCLKEKKRKSSTRNSDKVGKLLWTACDNADLWVVKKSDTTSSNKPQLYQISKINSSLVLGWQILETGYGYLFPIRESNITNRDLLIRPNDRYISKCRYGINVIESGSDYPRHLLITTNAYDELARFLEPVLFILPFHQKRCTIEQFSVQHGHVVNHDKVPWFPPGSSVLVKCDPGFGVKALNFTLFQHLTCSKNTRPKPCSTFTPKSRSEPYNLFIIVPSIISMVLMWLIVVNCWAACRKEGSGERRRGAEDETRQGEGEAGSGERRRGADD